MNHDVESAERVIELKTIKNNETSEVVQVEENSPVLIANLLKPMFLILKFFGSYHQVKDHWVFKVYCSFVIIISWFELVRRIFMFNFTQG